MNNEEYLHKLIKSSSTCSTTQIGEEKQILEGNDSTKDIARSSRGEQVIVEQESLVLQQQISKKKRARDEDRSSDDENGDGKKRADDRKQTNTNGNEAADDNKKKVEAEHRSETDRSKECSRGEGNEDSRVIVDLLRHEMTAPPRAEQDTLLPVGLGKKDTVVKTRREGEVNKHEQNAPARREGMNRPTSSTKTESYRLQNGEEDKKYQEVQTMKTPKENALSAWNQTDTLKVLQNEYFAKKHLISGSGRSEPFPQGLDGSISMSYGDFSRVKNDDIRATSTDPSGREPPFPVKLHRILSNPDFTDIICWLPHGRSWRVLKPKAFEERIIPMYFRHAKYASFMRQVNGWGFKRLTQGPDHNSYYHELFVCGMQHLCYKMRRLTKGRVDGDQDYNPDFYQLNATAQFPNSHVQNHSAMINASSATVNPSFQTCYLPGNFCGSYGIQNAIQHSFPYGVSNADMISTNPRLNEFVETSYSRTPFPNSLQHQHLNRDNGLIFNGANMENIKLEALQQRRKQILGQIRQMVENNNTNPVGSGIQGSYANTDISMFDMINSNSPNLQNINNSNMWGHHHLNQGSFHSNQHLASIQQMARFGGSEHYLGGNRDHSSGLANMIDVNNTVREGMNINLLNMNQQLFMQNAISGNTINHILGREGLNYNQIARIIEANNNLMRQQGSSSSNPSGNPSNGNYGSMGQM